MKLILITSPTYFVEESKIITDLFEEGLDILHLRKPDTPPMYAERLLTLIPKQYHKRIVVHDHFYLKEEFNLKGIHISPRNPIVPAHYKGHISRSCHSLEEVKEHKTQNAVVSFRKNEGQKTPDLTLQNERLVKAQKGIEHIAAVDHTHNRNQRRAQRNIQHQIGNALIPVAEEKPIDSGA